MGTEDDYNEAKHFLNKNTKLNTVGTLSRSEWEVASKSYKNNFNKFIFKIINE